MTTLGWQPTVEEADRVLGDLRSRFIRSFLRRAEPWRTSGVIDTEPPDAQRLTQIVEEPALFEFYFDAIEGQITIPWSTLSSLAEDSRRRREAALESGLWCVDLDLPQPLVASTEARLYQAAACQGMGDAWSRVRALETTPPDDREALRSAWTLLQQLWPEASHEIASTVRRCVFVESEGTLGAADFTFHGTVFIRSGIASRGVGFMLEELVHEAAHIYLNALFTLYAPLYLNPESQKIEGTPLRPDPRPMFGLLHQVFVLRRLVELYDRIEKYGALAPEARPHRETLQSALADGQRVLRRHARPSPHGEALFESLQ
ncbi:MAG: HEXXH motif-containing putative peptide modification protein [Myxococcota bacterium]